MRLMVICMAVILAIGFLLGGRLRNLSDLEIEWPVAGTDRARAAVRDGAG